MSNDPRQTVLQIVRMIFCIGTGIPMVLFGIESFKVGDVVPAVIFVPMGAGIAGIGGLPPAYVIISRLLGRDRDTQRRRKIPVIVLALGQIAFKLSVLVFLLGGVAGGLGIVWRGIMPLREGDIVWWGIFLIVVGIFMTLVASAVLVFLGQQALGRIFKREKP